MTNGNSAEREAFEKWALDNKYPEQRLQRSIRSDAYVDDYVDHLWDGWQARAELSVCADGGKDEAVWSSFPERDESKPAEQQGVFRKFEVNRVDGSDRPGEKHHGCRYFVLDMTHDAHAPAALRAYADSCAVSHPELAADLLAEFGTAPQAECAPRADALYTMDQMRDYAEAFYKTRIEAVPRADAEKDAALTESDISRIWLKTTGTYASDCPWDVHGFARAILAATKEK